MKFTTRILVHFIEIHHVVWKMKEMNALKDDVIVLEGFRPVDGGESRQRWRQAVYMMSTQLCTSDNPRRTCKNYSKLSGSLKSSPNQVLLEHVPDNLNLPPGRFTSPLPYLSMFYIIHSKGSRVPGFIVNFEKRNVEMWVVSTGLGQDPVATFCETITNFRFS